MRGLTGSIMSGLHSSAGGRELARELAAKHARTTCVLMMNEHAGPGFVAGLQQAGYRIPQDISILALASSLDTTIDQLEKKDQPLPQAFIGCSCSPGATLSKAPDRTVGN